MGKRLLGSRCEELPVRSDLDVDIRRGNMALKILEKGFTVVGSKTYCRITSTLYLRPHFLSLSN